MYILCICLFFNPNPSEIAHSEKAFAQHAKTHGIKAAFLAWLADDGLLYKSDSVVNGKRFHEAREGSKGSLWWQPDHVEASLDQTMGLSTGHYVYRDAGDDRGYYGQFLSVWEKQVDGTWKVAIDWGISHEDVPEKTWPSSETIVTPTAAAVPNGDLQTLDQAYAEAAKTEGWSTAFQQYSAKDIRFYRNRKRPVLGQTQALAIVRTEKTPVWKVMGAKMSVNKDFGFSYGKGHWKEDPDGKGFRYLRVWRGTEDGFKVIAEIIR